MWSLCLIPRVAAPRPPTRGFLFNRKLLPSRRRDERFQVAHQFPERFKRDLLRAVAPRFGGIRMHFNQQRVRAHRDRAFTHRRHEISAARALAGIDHDW